MKAFIAVVLNLCFVSVAAGLFCAAYYFYLRDTGISQEEARWALRWAFWLMSPLWVGIGITVLFGKLIGALFD